MVKTRKALFNALTALLGRRTFAKISVFDICAEALVSRTAFYAHFKDKYELLELWLNVTREHVAKEMADLSVTEIGIRACALFRERFNIIERLLKDADREQMNIMLRFVASSCGLLGGQAVVSNFLAGGIFYVVYTQTLENRNASDEEIILAVSNVYRLTRAIADMS
ncbi:MAG: TetR/AcrR family transcriptional regulator [Clostridiales bacterium]|nr:TetR/AcrR family transcriptional regulator [Clostridiales bacterium]